MCLFVSHYKRNWAVTARKICSAHRICFCIYNIIDSRYRSRKPLIVTTNLTLTELKNPQNTAHARIYDRLLELCTPIACTGPSMRKDIGQAKLNLLKALLA